MPRIAILSPRGISSHVSRANGYDFEDLIVDTLDDAILLAPSFPGGSSKPALRLANLATRRGLPVTGLGLGPAPAPLDQDVDLFFFHPATLDDLISLLSVPNWRKRSRVAICWFQELWVRQMPHLSGYKYLLDQFDHIVSPFHHTTEALAGQVAPPVSYLPWGVNTALFCPFPVPPRRVIDIWSLGRVDPDTLRDLIAHADATGGYFAHDTISGRLECASHAAHRRNYAGMLKRTKHFLTYRAKVDLVDQRGSQEEFGTRYVEAAAAGAVLVGEKVSNPAFETWFDWPDVVIPSPYGSREVPALIETLQADPPRIAAIRRRNVLESLGRNDHLHRWERILEIAGLKPHPKIASRREQLTVLAEMARGADAAAFLI